MTHLLYIMDYFMQGLTTPSMVLKYGHITVMAQQTGQKFLTNHLVKVFFMGAKPLNF